MNADYRRGFADGWNAARSGVEDLLGDLEGTQFSEPMQAKAPASRRKRKPSAYSKEYGRQYKRLKAKHPRASFGSLSKKAHAATRKAMK